MLAATGPSLPDIHSRSLGDLCTTYHPYQMGKMYFFLTELSIKVTILSTNIYFINIVKSTSSPTIQFLRGKI
jgi:hypothetical protein